MKSLNPIRIYLLILLVSTTSFAYSQDTNQAFVIQKGVVTVTPARCPPETCTPTSAVLTGTFSAEIASKTISFSNINVSSTPESGFTLPEAPNESSGGTTRNATFSFDGTQLAVSGVVDSRAFDGPLYEYTFAAQPSDEQGFNANGYYTARQDLRKCISPLCGGIFVKSVNMRLTKCADGSYQAECYVASANWEKLGFDPFSVDLGLYFTTPILLKGELIPHIYGGFGNLGEFVASEAYRPATNNPAEGIFAALKNKGIYCITTPCFSIDEFVLNSNKTGVISGFDLNPSGASAKDISTAYSLFANNAPLIVVGHNEKRQEMTGMGVVFIANQFYLPIQPALQK